MCSAPAQGDLRKKFFATHETALPEDTLAGGDFNVVPDVTLDVQNRNPLAYDNRGIQELTKMMRHASLIDERREQLETEAEPTRITASCSTRLDRWYVPSTGKMGEHLWTYDTTNTFIFKKIAVITLE